MTAAAAKPVEVVLFALDCEDDERHRLLRLLSDDERQRAAHFRFDIHRNRFIAGRARIRQILAARGNCSPAEIRFELNPYGKPSLAKPQAARGIHFNASSSDTLGAIAISKSHPLGLDIEKLKSDHAKDYDAIVASQFTLPEKDWYARHSGSARLRVFFEFWTCKEAYLKALGIGLSGKLDSFSINLEEAEPRVSDTELEEGGQSRLWLRRPGIDDDYLACLAAPDKSSAIDLSHWCDAGLTHA